MQTSRVACSGVNQLAHHFLVRTFHNFCSASCHFCAHGGRHDSLYSSSAKLAGNVLFALFDLTRSSFACAALQRRILHKRIAKPFFLSVTALARINTNKFVCSVAWSTPATVAVFVCVVRVVRDHLVCQMKSCWSILDPSVCISARIHKRIDFWI